VAVTPTCLKDFRVDARSVIADMHAKQAVLVPNPANIVATVVNFRRSRFAAPSAVVTFCALAFPFWP